MASKRETRHESLADQRRRRPVKERRRRRRKKKKETWWIQFRHFMNRKWVQATLSMLFLVAWSYRTADNFNESEVKLIIGTCVSTIVAFALGKR